MVKVTIEATGEEMQVLTGEIVNAVITTKDGCKVACIANSKNEVRAKVFIKSLVNLVNHSIEAYALDEMSEALLHMLFSMEMRNYAEKRLSDARKSKASEEPVMKKSEEDALNAFVEILRKAVEE